MSARLETRAEGQQKPCKTSGVQHAQQQCSDRILLKAQLDLFIGLGSTDSVVPGAEFALIIKLGNAIIAGDMDELIRALNAYLPCPDTIYKHSEILNMHLQKHGIYLHEPAISKISSGIGRGKYTIVLAVMHQASGMNVYVSSDSSIPCYVHRLVRGLSGVYSLEPVHEDPRLMLKQIGRLLRIEETMGPPPSLSIH